MVFTTCCSGSMLRPESRDDILFIPLDPGQTSWKPVLSQKRLIYLQKKTYGVPKINFDCRAFEMFSDNGNASQLIRELAADEWILFGNGLDLCVNAAVTGVLLAGARRVTFLRDCMCSSAKGYGPYGTEEHRDATFARWRKEGAGEQTLDQFIQQMEAGA